jgi:hypothetical protein
MPLRRLDQPAGASPEHGDAAWVRLRMQTLPSDGGVMVVIALIKCRDRTEHLLS